jgi:hypothetical protein
LALLSVYGPQSAFSVSGYSQRQILVKIFKKYGAVKNGKFISVDKTKVSNKDGNDAVDRLHYFINNNDLAALQPYLQKGLKKFTDSLQKAKSTGRNYSSYSNDYEIREAQMNWITSYLGLQKFSTGVPRQYYGFNSKSGELLTAKGFDYLLRFDSANSDSLRLKAGNIRVLRMADNKQVYTLYLNNDKISFNVQAFADSILNNKNRLNEFKDTYVSDYSTGYTLPDEYLTFTRQSAHYKVSFRIQVLRLSYNDGSETSVDSVEGWYLISVLK